MKLLLLLSLYSLFVFAAVAQSSETEARDWVPVDPDPNELSAGESVGLSGARLLALSGERSAQEQAIRIIDDLLDRGSIRFNDSEAVEVVRYVLGHGVTVINRAGGADFPILRIEAARLLARLGGSEARSMLYSVIEEDPEPLVVAEAVRSVAAMDLPPEERFYDILTARVRAMNYIDPDDSLAYTILNSVLAMHELAWQVEDPDLYEAIIGIARGDYGARVRRKAVEVLETLRED